jgi:hypothetical protein
MWVTIVVGLAALAIGFAAGRSPNPFWMMRESNPVGTRPLPGQGQDQDLGQSEREPVPPGTGNDRPVAPGDLRGPEQPAPVVPGGGAKDGARDVSDGTGGPDGDTGSAGSGTGAGNTEGGTGLRELDKSFRKLRKRASEQYQRGLNDLQVTSDRGGAAADAADAATATQIAHDFDAGLRGRSSSGMGSTVTGGRDERFRLVAWH